MEFIDNVFGIIENLIDLTSRGIVIWDNHECSDANERDFHMRKRIESYCVDIKNRMHSNKSFLSEKLKIIISDPLPGYKEILSYSSSEIYAATTTPAKQELLQKLYATIIESIEGEKARAADVIFSALDKIRKDSMTTMEKCQYIDEV